MKKKRKTGAVTVDTVLWSDVRDLILEARRTVVRGVNAALVWTNFEIGRRIVEYEQKGKSRAEYAERTIRRLAQRLTSEFGEGYSFRNLNLMRKFYLIYGEKNRIVQTVSAQSSAAAKSATPSRISGGQISQTLSAKSTIEQKIQTLSGLSESAPSEPAEKYEKPSRISDVSFRLSWSHYVFLMGINAYPDLKETEDKTHFHGIADFPIFFLTKTEYLLNFSV